MNVLLQFSNENFQISVSEIYLAGTVTQFKISFKQNWPRMLLIEEAIENLDIPPFTRNFKQNANA